MFIVSHVLVSIARRNTCLAHDDHTRRASINAETTARANIFVYHENHMVIGVGAGCHHVGRVLDRARRKHMDALPRTYIYAPFAHDAFRLINVEKLLRFYAFVQFVDGNFRKCVIAGEVRKRRVCFGFCHRLPLLHERSTVR